MIHFYLTALIPLLIGGVLWIKNKEIVWQEWAGGAVIAFLLAGGMHAIAFWGQTADIEMWSGQVTKTTHYPRWVEEYEVLDYCTRSVPDGNGGTRTETYVCGSHMEYRTHPEYWTINDTLGREINVSESESNHIANLFGGRDTVRVYKSGFYSGDHNIYPAPNRTKYLLPTTDIRHWKNKVKAAPSVFSFEEVPEDAPVFQWPKSKDWRESNRLLGTAKKAIPILEWDRMCARLGPSKHVNVIIIGFGDKDSSVAQLQQAAWIGGKKNDLVLCYGGSNDAPTWAYVFGWTDKELVKRNLESILLTNKINSDLLSLIETEIRKNYVIKNWEDFDYLEVPPPSWAYPTLLILMTITQVVFYIFAHKNIYSRNKPKSRYRSFNRY